MANVNTNHQPVGYDQDGRPFDCGACGGRWPCADYLKMKPEAVCTIESCPWNGQPMSVHPKRDRSHVPDYIEEPTWR